jgi:hypothetical protein
MITSSDNPGARGRDRMAQIAAQNAAEIKDLTAKLLGDLGRSPTGADQVLAQV